MSTTNKFKEIIHTVEMSSNPESEMKVSMFIPGVNSGAYSPKLVLKVWIKYTVWKIFKRRTFGQITLSINDVIELRDECNAIIEVAKKQGRIHSDR